MLSPCFGYTTQQLEATLTSQLHYIGPIRFEPSVAYIDTSTHRRIGARGENALAYLRAHQSKQVNDGLPNNKSATLLEATNTWLEKLGVGEALVFHELGGELFEPRVGVRRLYEVGCGLGQLLPIVVQCLAASEGSTVLLEQPEIHLHQKLQADLADFLMVMIARGVRIIVETHSEILIVRLRRRIAESNDGVLRHAISVYFISDGQAQPIPIDDGGNVEHWPDRFFDQGLIEMQALAEANASRLGRGG